MVTGALRVPYRVFIYVFVSLFLPLCVCVCVTLLHSQLTRPPALSVRVESAGTESAGTAFSIFEFRDYVDLYIYLLFHRNR